MGFFNKQSAATGELATTTIIAQGCNIKGELKLECDIQVDGCIEGKIRLEKLLVVSQSGRIEGEVFADKMIVGGIIKGKCYANTIEILENGKIEGDIYCDDLSIARGGKFLGSTHPEQKEQVVELKHEKKPEKKEASNKAIPKKATAANA